MRVSVAVCLVLVVVFCLQYFVSDAAVTDCQVRCPDGMMCVRLEDSNFHLCVRSPPSSSGIGRTQSGRGLEAGLHFEGRGDSQSQCPRPSIPSGPCVHQCRFHGDCRPDQACCSNGCGHTCISVTPSAVSKPGSCPRPTRQSSEACGTDCQGDGDCGGRRKCCRTRCGRTCQAPCFHWLSHSPVNPWRLSHRCSDSSPSWD